MEDGTLTISMNNIIASYYIMCLPMGYNQKIKLGILYEDKSSYCIFEPLTPYIIVDNAQILLFYNKNEALLNFEKIGLCWLRKNNISLLQNVSNYHFEKNNICYNDILC
jgi:hypothetical protein